MCSTSEGRASGACSRRASRPRASTGDVAGPADGRPSMVMSCGWPMRRFQPPVPTLTNSRRPMATRWTVGPAGRPRIAVRVLVAYRALAKSSVPVVTVTTSSRPDGVIRALNRTEPARTADAGAARTAASALRSPPSRPPCRNANAATAKATARRTPVRFPREPRLRRGDSSRLPIRRNSWPSSSSAGVRHGSFRSLTSRFRRSTLGASCWRQDGAGHATHAREQGRRRSRAGPRWRCSQVHRRSEAESPARGTPEALSEQHRSSRSAAPRSTALPAARSRLD